MNREELKKYIGSESLPIVDAMKMIDVNSVGLIYVVDEAERLCGCLTDGDIRRWIIRNGGLHEPISKAMNHEPRFIHKVDIRDGIKKMEDEKVYSIAVIDDDRNIDDIIFLEPYLRAKGKSDKDALKNTPVIVMAGGKGTRLYPYTKILPKPLIPVGDIPILERILKRFYAFGATEFYLTVNYKKEMIKSYFSEMSLPYHVHYVDEEKPLGTAGGIRLINEQFVSPVIVTNCDILIEADYKEIMLHHVSSGNGMTIVSSLKNTLIPYGVLHTKECGIVISMEEKPQLSHFINTGMYVVNPEFLDWLPENRFFHMTDLAEMMMKEGKQVGMYPISENSFLDMGEFEEMKKMEEWINKGI